MLDGNDKSVLDYEVFNRVEKIYKDNFKVRGIETKRSKISREHEERYIS